MHFLLYAGMENKLSNKRCFLIAALLVAGYFFSVFVDTQYKEKQSIIPLYALPENLDGWEKFQKPEETEYLNSLNAIYRADSFAISYYKNKHTGMVVNLILAYYKNIENNAWYHTPEICIRNSGWTITKTDYRDIALSNITIHAKELLAQDGFQQHYFLYWHQIHSFTSSKLFTFKMRWIERMNFLLHPLQQRGIFLVRIGANFTDSEKLGEIRKEVEKFCAGLENFLFSEVFKKSR